MKTKFIFKILIVMVLTSITVSCSEDFLNQVPRLDPSDELSLSSYVGLQNATIGAYSLLASPNWYGAGLVITADLKGGNAKRGPINSGRYVNEYLWNNNATATLMLWDDAYATIASANNIINKIDGGFTEAGVSAEQLDQLKGECLFLRALSHWDMVRVYSQPYAAGISNMGVPIVLVTENGYPSRNTVGEVYEKVVGDLTTAISLLTESNPRGNDNAWATKWSAKALLSKVYLYMGQWQLAADMATDIIDNGPFTLFTAAEYTTWDNNGFWGSGGSGSEIIFQVDGSQGNSVMRGDNLWEAISYMLSPNGYGDIAASQDLLDLYEAGDVRAELFVKPAAHPTTSWSLKYPGRLGSSPPLDFNTPVLRLAEIYLIRAEALLNGAVITGVTALDDINSIRTNRGLTVSAVSPSLSDIYTERRRELCFEGNELFDLARTERSLVRVDFNGSMRKDVPFVAGGTAIENYLWAMPIPQGECDANINMTQNPEY
jgi:starch-binding outer membrane protein, SusD/RagB family